MVSLAGDTAVSNLYPLQSIDQRDTVKITGAGFAQVPAPETASDDVAHAIHRAQVEKRPVVPNMPADFMWQEVNQTRRVFPPSTRLPMCPQAMIWTKPLA